MLRLHIGDPTKAVEESPRYMPGRGLIYSLLVHEIVFFTISLLSIPAIQRQQPRPSELIALIDLKRKDTLYLPQLGAVNPVEVAPSDNPKTEQRPARKGLSYLGRQPIISDLPKSTNRIQTLLRPALLDPVILPPPLSLPNIVQMAEVSPPPLTAPPLPQVKKAEAPAPAEPERTPPIAAPVIKIPEAPAKPTPPEEPSPAPKETVSPTPPAPTAKPLESLLALSPIPAPREDVVKVPSGEARGRFAISPEPNLDGSDDELSLSAADVRVPKPAPAPPTPAPPANTKNPASAGNANTETKKNPALTNPAAGRNDFPGITILGAGSMTVNGVEVGASPPTNPAPLQTSYGLTILSTEASGGGLPKFGVFSGDEQIYVVYVDMRRSMFDTIPSWTFEYAVMKPTSPSANVARTNTGTKEGLVLPFPTAKLLPAVPIELLRKYLQKMVIVSGIINVDGTMSKLEVKDSPDTAINGPVVAALAKWTFRPAQLDGEIVPVKVLLGIPLALP